MEAALDPYEVLHSTAGKANFQRITRLLISGGTSLLREIFDAIHPPSNLATILSNSDTKKQLKTAKLTKPQWDCLYPSPGVYGKSVDFDVTLLFRLLRTICGLAPPTTGWDALPASTDHSLNADLARVKHYRNSIYGHVNQGMEIKDEEFPSFWQDISETLVRIAGQISLPKKTAWQGAIDNLLNDPLTVEDERNVQELEMWYKSDMEIKKSIEEVCERMNRLEEELKEKTNVVIEKVQKEGEGIKEDLKTKTQDGMDMIETVVREEAQDITEKLKNTTREEVQDIKDQLGQMHQSIDRLSSSAATSQSAGARLRVRIDCEAITESGSMQGGATGIIQAPQEPRAVLLDAAVVPLTSHQPQIVVTTGAQKKTTGTLASQDSQVVQGVAVVPVTSRQTQAVVTTGSGGVNVGNEGLPSAQGVLNFIALKCFKEVDPSKPEELNGYLQYLKEVRKVLFVDAQSGSLIITVECGSVQILDELWEDYRKGHLNEMAQKFLVTEEILKELGLIAVKLTTTILREEYRACREYLFDIRQTYKTVDRTDPNARDQCRQQAQEENQQRMKDLQDAMAREREQAIREAQNSARSDDENQRTQYENQKRAREERERKLQEEEEFCQLKDALMNYDFQKGPRIKKESFRDLDVEEMEFVRLALIGPTGSGKTSFIGTLQRALGRTQSACEQSAGKEGTINLEEYSVQENITMVDTRGFFESDEKLVDECLKILSGRIRPGEEILRGYDQSKDEAAKGNPQMARKVQALSKYAHAVIFIVKANDPRLKDGRYKDTLKKIREHFREDGYAPVTVITYLDKLKDEDDKNNAFDMASLATGSSSERTFFIANYTHENNETSFAVERTALDILDFALLSAERFIRIAKQREKNQMEREIAAGGASGGVETLEQFFARLKKKYNWTDQGKMKDVLSDLRTNEINTVRALKELWEEVKGSLPLSIGMKRCLEEEIKNI